MNDFLFHGKRVDNGEWVEGLLFFYHDSFYQEYRLRIQNLKTKVSFEVDPDTVGQYSGKDDKNHKKIFDGNIIKESSNGIIGVVRFGEYTNNQDYNHIGFYIQWDDEFSDCYRQDLGFWTDRREIEVIGDVHDKFKVL